MEKVPRTPITPSRVLVAIAGCAAALLFTVAATTSGGTDLRPDDTSALMDTVRSREEYLESLQADVVAVREDVNRLSTQNSSGNISDALAAYELDAMVTPVTGPGVRVVLNDAPDDIAPVGVDDSALIVHEQDIQNVVNALWSGGAEAMMIQDRRVTSQTSIKCVGNSVILHGVPYAPPYQIVAVGDPQQMLAALDSSDQVQIYRQYALAYQLGYSQDRLEEVTIAGFDAGLALNYAKPAPA